MTGCADSEVALEPDPAHRTLVVVAVGGTHDELAGRQIDEPRQQLLTHLGVLSILAGMRVEPFAMERFQSTWEHQVRFNLSESGVHPLSVRELVGEGAALDAVLDQPLIYTQTNGTEALRTVDRRALPGRHRRPTSR